MMDEIENFSKYLLKLVIIHRLKEKEEQVFGGLKKMQ